MRRGRGLVGPLLPLLLLLAAALAVARRLDVVEVRGASMLPTLRPGDRLLVLRTDRAPRSGDVVLAADPRAHDRELIKRVLATGPRGLTLRGDNPTASTDGRAFGPVRSQAVRWRVLCRYWPVADAGRLPAAPDG